MRASRSLAASSLLLAAVILPLAGSAAAAVKPGDALPDLGTLDLDGTVPSLAGHVTLVDFWASWCPPCKASFPVMAELNKKYAEKGVIILGISVDEKANAYTNFIKRQTPPFIVVRDQAQKAAPAFGIPVMPTSYLIDRHGVVRYIHEGFYGNKSRDDYVSEIDALLAEKS